MVITPQANSKCLEMFMLGFLIRFIIEILFWPIPVGYDASTSYVLMCVCGKIDAKVLRAPLYPLLLMILSRLTGNALLTIKICSSIVSGFFMFSLAIWGQTIGISKSQLKGFCIAIYSFYVVMRLAWDLHRNLLAITFALLAISYRKSKLGRTIIFTILSIFSHPFAITIIGSAILADLLERHRESYILFGALLASIGAFLLVYSSHDPKFLYYIFSESWYISPQLLPIYILWLYAPTYPYVVKAWILIRNKMTSFKKILQRQMYYWIILSLIAAFMTKFSYRMVFMAAIPVAVMMFKVSVIKGNRRAVTYLIAYNIIISAIYPAFFYIFPVHPSFRRTHPPVLIGPNMFPNDGNNVIKMFRRALSMLHDNETIIVHYAEIAYAYIAGIPLCEDFIIITSSDSTFDEYLIIARSRGFHIAYIVWYINAPIGSVEAPLGGVLIAHEGNIGLFVYYLQDTFPTITY